MPLKDVLANILAEKTNNAEFVILANTRTDTEKALAKEKSLLSLSKRQAFLLHQAWLNQCHVKPCVALGRKRMHRLDKNVSHTRFEAEKAREKRLYNDATHGVIKAFNAIVAHQKKLQQKLATEGTTEIKREKILSAVSEKDFLKLISEADKSKK